MFSCGFHGEIDTGCVNIISVIVRDFFYPRDDNSVEQYENNNDCVKRIENKKLFQTINTDRVEYIIDDVKVTNVTIIGQN